jgi:hypothetical protein
MGERNSASLITVEWVQQWAHEYERHELGALEQRLFDTTGPAVADRGYFTRDEFISVGKWKASRATGTMNRNTDEDIEDVTRMALAAPLRLRHRVLTVLAGVQRPMASALLTVWRPTEHTVIDRYLIGALKRLELITEDDITYVAYLELCRSLVDRLGNDTSLRDLDRALWKWWLEEGRHA